MNSDKNHSDKNIPYLNNTTIYGKQFYTGVAIFLICIFTGIFIYTFSKLTLFYWFSGLIIGFVLQKSRFCFTAAVRDPYLTGGTDLTKALLVALTLTTVGFTLIKYISLISGEIIPGQEYINPIGISTMLGGFIFGIGMVISGGCASGVLVRSGEGFQTQLVVLIFFVIGALRGVHDWDWWNQNLIFIKEGIFLPDIFGWFGALSVQIILFIVIYYLVDKFGD